MDYERMYNKLAIEAVSKHIGLLPNDVQHAVKLAISVASTYGMPTCQEMQKELGENWVIARRTKRIIERYGEDVKCYSQKQYE